MFNPAIKRSKRECKKPQNSLLPVSGNVLGSNGSVVPLFTNRSRGGQSRLRIRYYKIFHDHSRGLSIGSRSGSDGYGGEIYIFDMGKPVKIIDLARKMIKLAGFIPDKDIMIKIVGLRPGEIIRRIAQ
jgi:FlaA1/EpsC-like NDP-sugar epimerase